MNLRIGSNIDLQEATKYIEEAQPLLAAKNLSLNDHIRIRGLLALMHLRKGNQDLARQEANKSLNLTSQTNFLIPYSYDGYAAPVEVYLTLWEKSDDLSGNAPQELVRLAQQGLKITRRLGRTFPIYQPRAALYQGRYEWLSGKHDKAKKAWLKSIDLAQQLDMPQEEGLAFYEYGRHLAPDDPDREKYLQRAVELFSEVEAAYYLDLAQKELRGKL
jgi:hypothetical protein